MEPTQVEVPAPRHWKRGFFTIAIGQAVSLIGSSAVQFALIWWLSSETGSALMLSLAGLFAFLPQMLLGPFVGVWVDRLKRKTVIICADLFIGLVAAGFAASFLFGRPPFWTACLVLGVRALGGVFHTPAIQAAIPMLVPREELVRANGWSQFLQSGAFMLGPVLGAAMYSMLPLPVILLTDLLGAIVACSTVAAVKIPELKRELQELPHFWAEMKAGASVFFQERQLVLVTVATTLCMVFTMPVGTFYPLMTSDYFHASAWHASAVELLYAAGMMGCAALIGTFGKIRKKFFVIHLGFLLMGGAMLTCGLLPPTMWAFWIFAALCALLGASSNLCNIPYTAYLQENVPHEAQGRVFSLTISLMSFAMPLGLVVAGPVAERLGVAFWFLVAGIAVLVIGLFSALLVLPGERAHHKE